MLCLPLSLACTFIFAVFAGIYPVSQSYRLLCDPQLPFVLCTHSDLVIPTTSSLSLQLRCKSHYIKLPMCNEELTSLTLSS